MYKAVLTEASTVDDLRDWLDRALLTRLWPDLWLPLQLRRSWEDRFPELGIARTAAA
jgi:hypothetical protein